MSHSLRRPWIAAFLIVLSGFIASASPAAAQGPAPAGEAMLILEPSFEDPAGRIGGVYGVRFRSRPGGPWRHLIAAVVDGRLRQEIGAPDAPFPGLPLGAGGFAIREEPPGSGQFIATADLLDFDLEAELAAGRIRALGPIEAPELALPGPSACAVEALGAGGDEECDPAKECPDCNCTDVVRETLKKVRRTMIRRGFNHDDEIDCEVDKLYQILRRDQIILDKERKYAGTNGECEVAYYSGLARKIYVSPECLCKSDKGESAISVMLIAMLLMNKNPALDEETAMMIATGLFLDSLFDGKRELEDVRKLLMVLQKFAEAAEPDGCSFIAQHVIAYLEALKYAGKEDREVVRRMKEALEKMKVNQEKWKNLSEAEQAARIAAATKRMERLNELLESKDWDAIKREFGIERSCLDKGAAAMAPAKNASPDINPRSVAAGDFDLDGDQDLAAVLEGDAGEGSVAILLNDGGGEFRPPDLYDVGPGAASLIIVDLDGDGALDIAAAAAEGIRLLRNGGGGRFRSLGVLPAAEPLAAVVAGDLDSDGRPDILATGPGAAAVSVFRNLGAMAFAPFEEFLAGVFPSSIAIGDLDGDGDLDLVAASGSGAMAILNGGGAGGDWQGFLPPVAIGPGGAHGGCAIHDLDGDRRPEVILADDIENAVRTFRMQEAGPFEEGVQLSAGLSPRAVAAGDLDGDRIPDIACAGQGPGGITVLFAHGGGFSPAAHFPIESFPVGLALADLDSDGDLDAAVAAAGLPVLINDLVIQPTDCDGDGEFDECAIASGRVPDCDGNGVPDSCDIASGALADPDGNGIPDLCEEARFRYSGDDTTVEVSGPEPVTFELPLHVEEAGAAPGAMTGIQAFTLGLMDESPGLEPVAVEPGASLAVLNGGLGPAFFRWEVFPDAVRLQVQLDPASPGEGLLFAPARREVARIVFSFSAEADAGNDENRLLYWSDNIGPVLYTAPANLVVTGAGGRFFAAGEPVAVRIISLGPRFLRADPNDDGGPDISDAVTILGFLFLGDPATLACEKSADVDDSGDIDISDAIGLLGFLFLTGEPPAAPYPLCGEDPTADRLSCLDETPCG